MDMGRWLGLLGVIALFACAAAPVASAAEPPPAEPTCAEGPVREGDEIVGTPCADHIVVPPSVTYVNGGAGNDVIVEGPASAAVAPSVTCPAGRCGVGSQTFEGGEGNDTVYGERGNDILRGNGGDDRLYGGIGDDQLLGGPGNDLLDGGFGADSIDGGEGSDFVRGGGTTDRIFDSGGNVPGEVDTLSYADGVTPGFGAGAVQGVNGFPNGTEGEQERGVYLYLAPGAPEPKEFNGNNGGAPEGGGADQVEKGVFETIIGSPYADYIVGGEGGETIYGGGGADVIEGRGGEDHLFGGADGDDLDGGGQPGDSAEGGEGTNTCQGVPATPSCSVSATKAVVPRTKSKVSVGTMASGVSNEIYLTASSGNDTVTATDEGSLVTFAIAAGAGFQKAAGGVEEGCSIVSTTTATCPAAGLGAVTIAGLGGEDHITASGFPQEVPVTILGGEGPDTLTGGQVSEDVIVDGKGNSVDTLSGLGGDDALIHQDGADQLLGGEGNDLFLSSSICDGETINGESGVDNSSWAKLKTIGVDARLDASPPQVGEVGVGAPGCKAGTTDKLVSIEDLEGSEQADHLEGDAGPNQLLGHRGADEFLSGEGEDTILANSEDSDASIDCGPATDVAVIDIPHPGLYEDPAPVECETVRQGVPEEEAVIAELPAPPATVTPPAPVPVPVPKPRRDTVAPRTAIARRPAKLVRSRRPRVAVTFRFSASERSTFRCKLDRGPYKACRSPRHFKVAAGAHVFRVFAIDAAGNRDRTPATFAFRVKRIKAARRHPH
jgi:Ca2+-binding RTX toxin-like protein